MRVWGLGFRVWGSGFGFGFLVLGWGFRFRFQGVRFGFRFPGLWSRSSGLHGRAGRFRDSDSSGRVRVKVWVSGFWLRVAGWLWCRRRHRIIA